jgi:steroid delta-isomerase-like uncharacterized protein
MPTSVSPPRPAVDGAAGADGAAEAAAFLAAFEQAWNAHDLDGLAALVAPDFEGTDVAEAGVVHGPEGFRRQAAVYLTAFPDLRLTFDEVFVNGDRVAVRWSTEATHAGPFLRVPPTHRRVHGKGVTLFTLEGGRVRRSERVWDVANLLRAFGLLPDLPVEPASPRHHP